MEDEKLENEDVQEEPLATEILTELKIQNKRVMRIVYALIVSIVLIVGGFLLYMYQYDFSSYEITSNDGGNASFIGNDGDIYNGYTKSPSQETQGQ